MESQFPATLLSVMSGRNLSQAWGGVCGGTDFLYSDNFNLQGLPLHSDADEMPMYFDVLSDYTIDDDGGNFLS
jgi:hypothetical protein